MMYTFEYPNNLLIRLLLGLALSILTMGIGISEAFSQKPGKEKIEIELPNGVKWKREKVKGNLSSIRQEIYTPTSFENAEGVLKIDILTIDKRYYPVSARETLENSWKLRQSICPNSSLDIVHQEKDERGLKIIYILRNPKNEAKDPPILGEDIRECTEAAWIFLAAEGPTAMHAIEVHLNEDEYTPELAKKWVEILKNRTIK